jgi:hypothetical protein
MVLGVQPRGTPKVLLGHYTRTTMLVPSVHAIEGGSNCLPIRGQTLA